jgi:UDP-2-acetamido-3-amino-2,3-dideoxy-glucuronate N-acetyltransferase
MAGDEKDVRVAVLGAGYWGRNLVRNFHELGRLELVADPDPAARAYAREKYPEVKVADGLEGLLKEKGFAAVAVATPAAEHARGVSELLKAGLDVLVEKPLALTAEDGAALADLARERGRILMADHLLNRHPAVVRLKELISSGELGRVCRVWTRRLNFGKIRQEEDCLWSFAPHDVYMLLNLLSASPLSVSASKASYLTPGVADAAEAELLFPGGVTAHVSVSWLNPLKETRLGVVGMDKMAVFDDQAPWPEKLALFPHRVRWRGGRPEAEKGEATFIELAPAEPLKEQCLSFLRAVESRKEPPDSGAREALATLSLLSALDRAAREGRRIDLDPSGSGKSSFVHPTALVDSGAFLGPGSKVWHFSHILEGSVVGGGTNIGQNVVIGPRVRIGSGCKIQNNVSVYEGVTLEDDVFCGPSMVFTNVFNPRAFIKRMSEVRPTLVKKGASVGANATIVCGHTLGEYSFIAAGAVVTKDVPAYALMRGNPARRAGWMCRCGEKLPESLTCSGCGSAYREKDGTLAPL